MGLKKVSESKELIRISLKSVILILLTNSDTEILLF
jgi:hypothetical protein